MSAESLGFLISQEPLPFEHLFVPQVLEARARLRRQFGTAAYELLTPEAHAGWERYLLVRLTTAGAKAALWQFGVYQTVRRTFARVPGARKKADVFYKEFVGESPENRLQQIFDEFPALRLFCAVLIENWLSTVAEFLVRLDGDWTELEAHFPNQQFVAPVRKLEAGLSDPHRGGRCVVQVTFENGTAIIYKPRSTQPEVLFAALVEEINAQGIPHPLMAARCWNRGDYGWMEFIRAMPCSEPKDVETFYWSAGALLGLVYLARGVDLHRQNLIAFGRFPVLVDLEALWHPQKPSTLRQKAITDSVLGTGFLSFGDPKSGEDYGWGALSKQSYLHHTLTVWSGTNEDNMAVRTTLRRFASYFHLPTLAGELRLATDYVACIQEGFRWMGRHLFEDERRRRDFDHWICTMATCPRRLILRPTARYQSALEQLTQAQNLRRKQLVAEKLTGFTRAQGFDSEESRMLEQMDIPYFDQAMILYENRNEPDRFAPSQEEYFAQIPLIADALEGTN